MPVYVIRAGDTEFVKIGWADDVTARLRDLQVGNHEKLVVIRTIDAERPVEGWLHQRFRSQRVHYEWFVLSDDMLTIEPPVMLPRNGRPAVDAIIAAFGGREAIMGITGAARNAVNNWRHDGIPWKHWPALIEAAEANGIDDVTLDTLDATRAAA